jgi:hypothetical protein
MVSGIRNRWPLDGRGWMDVFTMPRWDDFVEASMATGENGRYGVSFFLAEEFRQRSMW